MDPLQELYQLIDEEMAPPSLEAQDNPFAGTPADEDSEVVHPVIQQRKKVDALRGQGMDVPDAYNQVYGQLDPSDTEGKRQLSSTFGRTEDDGKKNVLKTDKDSEFKSIAAIDHEINSDQPVSADDVRTRTRGEVPSELQQQEEYDYNWDVSYLQKYGRA